MPKERVIHGETTVYDKDGHLVNQGIGRDIPGPEDAKRHTEPSIDIHWDREQGHVQVAVEFPRDAWIATADDLKADPRVSDKAIYTGSLRRQEINHLIRTLRRARDAAYGADE